MVKITNGDKVLLVTNGAFENTFKKQGFEIVKEGKKAKVVNAPELSDEEFEAAIVEKPIEQWTKAETKRYAELIGVELGNRKLEEVKAEIKELL